jgi:hypothetical protein
MLSAKRTGMVSSKFLWKPPVTSRSQRVPFGCVAKLDMCPYAAGQNEAGKDANEAKDCMRLKRRITPRRTVDEGKTCPAAYTLSSDKHKLHTTSASRLDFDRLSSGLQRHIYCASNQYSRPNCCYLIGYLQTEDCRLTEVITALMSKHSPNNDSQSSVVKQGGDPVGWGDMA